MHALSLRIVRCPSQYAGMGGALSRVYRDLVATTIFAQLLLGAEAAHSRAGFDNFDLRLAARVRHRGGRAPVMNATELDARDVRLGIVNLCHCSAILVNVKALRSAKLFAL